MFYSKKQHLIAVTIFVLFAVLAGCARYTDNTGKTARAPETVALLIGAQEWQYGDIRLQYEINQVGNSQQITGFLHLSDRIYSTYRKVDYFNLYINYLDGENRVIITHDITPNIRIFIQYQDQFKLPTIPPPPPGTASYVFNYWGEFLDNDDEQQGAGNWEIYYNPFIRE